MNSAVPYMLKPKATRLPAGHDGTLDPPEPPTDALERGVAPSDWLFADATPGGTDPPDAAVGATGHRPRPPGPAGLRLGQGGEPQPSAGRD